MKRVIALLCAARAAAGSASAQNFEPGKDTDVEIRGAVGTLRGTVRLPDELGDDGRCPVVLVLHGLSSNRNTKSLATVVDSLCASGIATVRFDFNGHGRSDGRTVDMTLVNETEDAAKMLRYVESLPFAGEIGVVGHSQGGTVAIMLCAAEDVGRIRSCVLMAPGAMICDYMRKGKFFGDEFDPEYPPDSITFKKKIPIGRAYIKTAQMIDIYGEATRYNGPMCVIHGSADPTVPLSSGRKVARRARHAELHVLKGMDHGFTQDRTAPAAIAASFFRRTLSTERR